MDWCGWYTAVNHSTYKSTEALAALTEFGSNSSDLKG